MPDSIVPRVIEILLLGQKMKESQAQRKRDELTDELLRERIADLRWQRKQKDPLTELGLQILGRKKGAGESGLGQIDFSKIKDPIAQAGIEKVLGKDIDWRGYEPKEEKILTGAQRYYKEHPGAEAGSWEREQKKIGREFEKPSEYDYERDIRRVMEELGARETGIIGPKTPSDILKRQARTIVAEKEFPSLGGPKEADREKEIAGLKKEWRKYRLSELIDPKDKSSFEAWAADLNSAVRFQLGKELGFYKMPETLGQPRQTKRQKLQRTQKPINYSGMAGGLKKLYGVETKKTLEAYRGDLESSYPGLDWEELKKHFK